MEELNPAQLEAVTTIDGPVLVLAGAGSGKTKTITSRLAYLIGCGIDPASTLTLTFTNKAAQEMRERAMALVEGEVETPPLLATFHKFGLSFLKQYIHLLERRNDFIIIDTDDQRRILRQLAEESELHPVLLQKEISRFKNSLLSPAEIKELPDCEEKGEIYEKYQNYLIDHNLVDFDDLLLLTYSILDREPELAFKISNRYQFIMVDEYQDTNSLQLQILKKLCSTHNNICVVGDDDQAIYGWRGADHRNILNFEKEFGAKVVILEYNYRSTPEILEKANRLISYNKNRYQKRLKAVKESGPPVEVKKFPTEREEANWIAGEVTKLLNQGVDPSQIAILYRINALSRSLEEGLRNYRIPYKLVGGITFYEREEIKDLISYLRLIANPDDDYSFLRIVNKPKRGIGKVTLAKLEEARRERGDSPSLFRFIEGESLSFLPPKPRESLKEFVEIIRELQNYPLHLLPDRLEELVKFSSYYPTEEKRLNVEEFYGMMREREGVSLTQFLNELSLESDQDFITDGQINIMTIHASKGLEFDHLFVIGWEEPFFPLESSDLEEERRLAYVAITRAKRRLVLTYVGKRFVHGKRRDVEPSRFLVEAGLVKGRVRRSEKGEGGRVKPGRLVNHPIFGKGKILGVNRVGKKTKLKIDFGGTIREILSDFVELL